MTEKSPTHYEQFLSEFPLQTYPTGSMLISPCEELAEVMFLQSGAISKYTVTKYGEKAVMNIFTTPALLPLSWILNKTPNRYYFEAQTPVEIRWIPADKLSLYLRANPGVTYELLQQVYAGLESTQQRITYLMRGSLKSRLLFELVIEARRAGEMRSDGSQAITVNEAALAERAGLSRETISRELAKLFRSGDLCKREGRSIVIQDVDALDEMLRQIV